MRRKHRYRPTRHEISNIRTESAVRHTDESDRLESCPAMLNVGTRVHSDASGLSTSVKVSEMLNSPAGSAKRTRGTTSGGDVVSAQHG